MSPLGIRTIIVDDEPLARDGVRFHLEKDSDFIIVDEAANGAEAIKLINLARPDLAFLDVEMPGMSGFDVLKSVPPEILPPVVFVTAYDHYAIPAFEVNAIDYLLKPIDPARFAATRDRIKAFFRDQRQIELSRRLTQLLDQLQLPATNAPTALPKLKRLAVTERDTTFFVDIDEIDWIEAADYYVKLHTGKKTHLLRETLGQMERQLDPSAFVRIHRSTIVRIDRVKELRRQFEGSYIVVLKDGTQLKSSRNYRDSLQTLLGFTDR